VEASSTSEKEDDDSTKKRKRLTEKEDTPVVVDTTDTTVNNAAPKQSLIQQAHHHHQSTPVNQESSPTDAIAQYVTPTEAPDSELLQTPNQRSISPWVQITQHNLRQVLSQFPTVERMLSNMHSLLKGSISADQEQVKHSSDHSRSIEREIRQQRTVQQLQTLCEQQQASLNRLEALEQQASQRSSSDNEQTTQLQALTKLHKLEESEILQLQHKLNESEHRNEQCQKDLTKSQVAVQTLEARTIQLLHKLKSAVQLRQDLDESQAVVLALETALQDKERQHVAEVDELASRGERQESQIRRRDVVLRELQDQQESLKTSFQSHIQEALENLKKRDAQLKLKNEQLQERDLYMRRVAVDNKKLRERLLSLRQQTDQPSTSQKNALAIHRNPSRSAAGGSPAHHRQPPDDRKRQADTSHPKLSPRRPDANSFSTSNQRFEPEEVPSSLSPGQQLRSSVPTPPYSKKNAATNGRTNSPTSNTASSSSSVSSSRRKTPIVPGESFKEAKKNQLRSRASKNKRKSKSLRDLVPFYDSLAEAGSVIMIDSD
jgi:hypothetical protein